MSETAEPLNEAPPLHSLPEPESRDNEEFQVYSQAEILGLLRELQENHLLVTIYFQRGEDFLVSTLLAVDADEDELIFDAASDSDRNNRMIASERLIVVSFVERVKLQFVVTEPALTTWEGRVAVRMRVPDSILRLQRRDNFRVPTSHTNPLPCSVASPDNPNKRVPLTVLELSSGGIGVLVNAQDLMVLPRTRLEDFELELPGLGTVRGGLEVRHVSEGPGSDRKRYRLGCTYLNLTGAMRMLVQRYVNTLQRERLTRR